MALIHDAATQKSGLGLIFRTDAFDGLKRIGFNNKTIKFCAGLSLLLILSIWSGLSDILEEISSIDANRLFLAIVIFGLQFALSCARWMLILGRQRENISARKGLSIFGIGTLANVFFVTSIAGMTVRAALLVRVGTSLSSALAAVTVERIAAMAGLALCGLAGLVVGLSELQKLLADWDAHRLILVVLCGLVLCGSVLGLLVWKMNWLTGFVQKLWCNFASPNRAMQLVGVSTAIVLLGFAGVAVLAAGMGLDIDPLFFLLVMPTVALISALPISLGGWGVREAAMVAGLSIYSIPNDAAMALSISYALCSLLVTLCLGSALAVLGQSDNR